MSNLRPPSLNRPVAPRSNLSSSANDDYGMSSLPSGSGGSGVQNSRMVPLPPVFRDLSNLDTPDDIKGLFKACRFLSRWSGVHKAYVVAMSTFPITDIVIKNASVSSDALRRAHSTTPGVSVASEDYTTSRMQELIDTHWNIKKVNQEAARSFWTYSNAVAVLSYPFVKTLRCSKCETERPAIESSWELRSKGVFHWKCPECSYYGRADVFDSYIDAPEDVRIVILDVERIEALKDDFRDEVIFYYEIPLEVIDRIKRKPLDKEYICNKPQPYLEAALGKPVKGVLASDFVPRVKLRKDSCFHLRAASMAQSSTGMAFPEMAATLKDYWLLRLLQKAQEAIASDYIVPLRFIYPEASSKSGNLFEMINVPSYMDVLRREVAAHRQDPNYIPIVPFPIGYQVLGGEAKALMLAQEIRVIMEQICAGLGVPLEMVFGGMSYSGSNVSIKQQEVKFRDFRQDLLAFNRWAVDHISKTMGLPAIIVEHKEFRMGDDSQRMQMLSMFQQSNVTSIKRLHDELGIDSQSEKEQILLETEWLNKLNERRMKVEASMQEHSMVRQMAAQAEGMIRGTEAQLEARNELAKKVRSDADLYNLVKSDPQLVLTIFGPNSVEGAAMGPPVQQQQMTPDPQELAPSADQQEGYGPGDISPDHLSSLIMDMMGSNSAAPENEDPVGVLVREFQDLPSVHWSQKLEQIRTEWGQEIANRVTSKLAEAQMMMMQQPELQPARRENFNEQTF